MGCSILCVFVMCLSVEGNVQVSRVCVLSVSFVWWVKVVCILLWSLLHLTCLDILLYCINTIFPLGLSNLALLIAGVFKTISSVRKFLATFTNGMMTLFFFRKLILAGLM